jgi:hypothetical protein
MKRMRTGINATIRVFWAMITMAGSACIMETLALRQPHPLIVLSVVHASDAPIYGMGRSVSTRLYPEDFEYLGAFPVFHARRPARHVAGIAGTPYRKVSPNTRIYF